jgi:2-hydroxy-6-oxonona-2,4-dienedioate hydrolase
MTAATPELDVHHPTLSADAQAAAAAMVADLDAQAGRTLTPCGAGSMVWRHWGPADGPPVILVHGGAGAWSHWIRNIGPLLEQGYSVWAPDVPGLGDSDMPEALTMDALCGTVERGADQVIPQGPVDVIGFSFGGPVATSLAKHLGSRLRNLVLAASRFVAGYQRIYPELITWKDIADPQQRLAAHRVNLGRIMMAREANIDALAVYLQATNAARSRFFGPKLNPGGRLLDCLPLVQARGRVTGISGVEDQGATGIIDKQEAGLQSMQPGAKFFALADAGHWVQYEAAERFNRLMLDALKEGG